MDLKTVDFRTLTHAVNAIANMLTVREYLHEDCLRRNQNINDAVPLCISCDGTGNELYRLYRKCQICSGTGRQ